MISVDPLTFIIFVPKADLTLVQTVPTEVRELNLDLFRMWLKDWEDGDGIVYTDTHRHNTEVTISGLTLARVIEILEPYTITFEDGQYAVNLVAANSNVSDRVNLNQVSVRSNNSAGLIVVSAGSVIAPTQQQIRDAMALSTAEIAAAGSIDNKLGKIKSDTGLIPGLL